MVDRIVAVDWGGVFPVSDAKNRCAACGRIVSSTDDCPAANVSRSSPHRRGHRTDSPYRFRRGFIPSRLRGLASDRWLFHVDTELGRRAITCVGVDWKTTGRAASDSSVYRRHQHPPRVRLDEAPKSGCIAIGAGTEVALLKAVPVLTCPGFALSRRSSMAVSPGSGMPLPIWNRRVPRDIFALAQLQPRTQCRKQVTMRSL